MNHRDIALAFLNAVAFGRVEEGFQEYTSDSFVHHNPYFKGDRNSLKEAMISDHEKHPNLAFEIKKTISEGDAMMTYSLVTKKDVRIAVVHMFSISDGKITEMWDIGQVIDSDSPNENGMF